jgi:hypothetical protein
VLPTAVAESSVAVAALPQAKALVPLATGARPLPIVQVSPA